MRSSLSTMITETMLKVQLQALQLNGHTKFTHSLCRKYLGPTVQSIVSLTSSLVVKMLTVPVSTISNAHEFLLKKCSFCKCKSYSQFSAKIIANMPYSMIKVLIIQ